jgi:hypothetical protein
MVRDNVTGLIWENKTDDDSLHDKDNTYTWYDPTYLNLGVPGTNTKDFIDALNNAHFGGYDDWRMPTHKELSGLINYSIPDPGATIDSNYFPDTQPSRYWSGISVFDDPTKAWAVEFDGTNNWGGYSKSESNFTRAVRGAQAQANYVDSGNGTITDRSTGLMWQKQGTTNKTWEQALSYCEELSLGGFTDWRLPTIKEMRSLVDLNRSNPAINTTVFPDTVSSSYWSNTTFAGQDGDYNQNSAWAIIFSGGGDAYNQKSTSAYVRAVRVGIQSDFNRDGNPDILLRNASTGENAVWFMDGISRTGTASLPIASVLAWT